MMPGALKLPFTVAMMTLRFRQIDCGSVYDLSVKSNDIIQIRPLKIPEVKTEYLRAT